MREEQAGSAKCTMKGRQRSISKPYLQKSVYSCHDSHAQREGGKVEDEYGRKRGKGDCRAIYKQLFQINWEYIDIWIILYPIELLKLKTSVTWCSGHTHLEREGSGFLDHSTSSAIL